MRHAAGVCWDIGIHANNYVLLSRSAGAHNVGTTSEEREERSETDESCVCEQLTSMSRICLGHKYIAVRQLTQQTRFVALFI